MYLALSRRYFCVVAKVLSGVTDKDSNHTYYFVIKEVEQGALELLRLILARLGAILYRGITPFRRRRTRISLGYHFESLFRMAI